MNYKTQDQIPLEWQPGDVVLDKYEIREVFEGGGMGRVYRAYDREWNIDLAIKSPRENYYKTQAQIDLFLAEAEKWMRLGMHPNLTTCFYVQALGATPRLFAEFVEGGTLSDWIASGRYSRLDGNGKFRSILGLAIQFARGLEYSHNKGLIHQDVKPANVLMTITGSPKVTDFGLANARLPESGTASESDAGRTILVPGSGFFTEAYASPEQAAGQPLSRKTDIWSWAVSMIEAIVGGRDWTHGLAAPFVLQRIYTNGYVNASIFGLLNDCLERRPEHRPESFSNIIQRLQEIFEETLGEKFPDIEKDMPALSADSLNNRAVSLITIGKAFGDAPNDGLSLLYNLRTISTRHILGKINLMLLNWRSGQTSTWTITKELEDLMSRPDFYEFVNEKWIFNYYIQNIRHEKAIKFVSRLNHKTLESEAQTAVADLTRIRESLLDLFNGLDGSYKKSAMSCLGLSIHHSPSEALVDTSAPDYGIIGYKFGDTLRIIDLNSTTLFEVEEVDSFCLSEDGSKLLILNFESSDEQFKDKGYCSFTCRIFDINTGIKTHDLPSGFGMPGPPGRYCIDYKLTISSDGLSASIWICEGNRWTTIDYEFDHKKNNWSVFHDFRKQNSVQSARLLKVLANGTRLIAVNGSYIEIWEMERTVIVRCLLAINLDEFGVIRIQGCLPGFRMWRGWEFEADVWNIYQIFESLTRLESRNPDPYIIVKPPDYDSMADRQQRLSVLLDDMYRFEASDNRAMVLDRIDRILVFEASTGIDLFQKRHEIVSTHPCRVLSKVWHEDSKNQYWDTEIFGVNSEIENLFVLKRYRSINDLNLGLYSKLDGRRHSDCLFALEHREGWQDESWFGVCLVTSETSLYLVKNSRNYESDYSVVLINDGGRECEKIINEWDLNSNDSKWETFTNQFVVIEDRIIYRDCTNGIWIRDACTGEKLHHTVVDDEISIIRKVAFTDSICLAVGTASTGRLFIYDKEGNQLTSIDVGLGQGGFVEDVSYTCSVAVLKKRNHSWVYIDLLNRREKIICNRFFDDHGRWGFDVDIGFRLSQCGRAVVGYEGGSLWLVDLRSGKEVYRWRPPAGLLVPPCFDASGRWLLVVHSKNSYEVLQLFWDIDEKGESFDLDIN